MNGNIIDIEKFAIHDGPGIRTTVFLDGCPLRCPWCANPESQIVGKFLMYNAQKCLKCGTCVNTCPNKLISVVNDELVFDRDKCVGCERCAKACPGEAITFSGSVKSSDEIITEVMKDKDYYDVSGGGVTFSGGEAFLQFDFFYELLTKAKEHGLNTAVETTGNTDFDNIKKAEPLIDTFLFDMKHIDPEMIISVTKGDGYLIQENFRKLAEICPEKMIMRVPVIPGFNYDEKTLCALIDMAKELNISGIHLLPYHNLGSGKYDKLSRDYKYRGLKNMDKSELQQYAEYGEKIGYHVQIGG